MPPLVYRRAGYIDKFIGQLEDPTFFKQFCENKRDGLNVMFTYFSSDANKEITLSLLMYIAQQLRTPGYHEILTKLVDAGLNVNAQNKYGTTALMCCCRTGDERGIRLLLELGADLELYETFELSLYMPCERTAFMLAFYIFNHISVETYFGIVRCLVYAGANAAYGIENLYANHSVLYKLFSEIDPVYTTKEFTIKDVKRLTGNLKRRPLEDTFIIDLLIYTFNNTV